MGDPSWQGQDRLLHAVLWTGSDRPSLLRTLVTKALFACRHVLPVSQAACSADARKLRAFFAALKHMCTESVDGARVAFLAIVCPPTPQFTYHLAARHTTLLGLPVFWSGTPPNSCKLLVVYVHGGGFVSGDYSGYQGMCEDLGQALGPDTCVLFPQYPLAPEVNWLRIVNKVTASITAAAKQDVPLAVFADSAGGAIALASCLALCAGNGPKPSALCLFSPLLDAEGLGASRVYNTTRDVCFTGDLVRWSFKQCLRGLQPAQVNPLNQSFRAMCPVFVRCSADEVLLSDAEAVHRNCTRDGVHCDFLAHPCSFHTAVLFNRYCAEGRRELEDSVQFVRKHV